MTQNIGKIVFFKCYRNFRENYEYYEYRSCLVDNLILTLLKAIFIFNTSFNFSTQNENNIFYDL
jgi:hypothetical protein